MIVCNGQRWMMVIEPISNDNAMDLKGDGRRIIFDFLVYSEKS